MGISEDGALCSCSSHTPGQGILSDVHGVLAAPGSLIIPGPSFSGARYFMGVVQTCGPKHLARNSSPFPTSLACFLFKWDLGRPVTLETKLASESPGGLGQARIAGPTSRVSVCPQHILVLLIDMRPETSLQTLVSRSRDNVLRCTGHNRAFSQVNLITQIAS